MPTRNVLLLFLCGLVAVVGLACGSGGGGDDDHAADDDVSDDDVDDDLDDDLTPDDDADDDNDDDVDDDLDDDLDDDADDVSDDDVDDDLDDDADDDTTPDDDSMPDDDVESNALLLMGADASGPASWQQTTEGWVRRDFPPPVTQGFIFDLGPSFFVDGEKGWTTWNVWGDAVTNGHDWLVYDLENGWQYDTGHWRAGAGTVVELLFAADADHLWATSYYDMFGFGSEHLWKYIGPIPVPQLTTLSNPQFTAMFFPNANSGLVSGYIGSAGFLYRYDGPGWTELAMPAGYESGSFDWLWLADVRNGWGVWEAYAGGRHLMALADGVWSEVTPPADCADYRPTQVFGAADYAITVDRSGPDHRFLEFREGVWTCRNVGGELYGATIRHALVLRDGTEVLAAATAPGDAPLLFLVTLDSVTPIELPAEISSINGVHALSPNAPEFSALVEP